jgi:hypothetical protein
VRFAYEDASATRAFLASFVSFVLLGVADNRSDSVE